MVGRSTNVQLSNYIVKAKLFITQQIMYIKKQLSDYIQLKSQLIHNYSHVFFFLLFVI